MGGRQTLNKKVCVFRFSELQLQEAARGLIRGRDEIPSSIYLVLWRRGEL